MTSAFDYDLFVIGAGSGGVRAARLAGALGKRVAIAEESRVGGTCVIRGCVPKKLFSYAAHVSEDIHAAAGFGWTIPEATFDWSVLKANKDKEIERLNGIYLANLEKAGVRIFHERAVFEDAHTLRLVTSDRKITAETILIATGGRPRRPTIEGGELALVSDDVFELDRLADTILVVGGGYIAVEFANVFEGLGRKVEMVYRGDKLLRSFDEDVREHLTEDMRRRGIDVHVGADLQSIERRGKGLRVALQDGRTIDTGMCLAAIGRDPNTDGLGLDKIGVECDAHGSVVVNRLSRTNVPHIYAVGDVTNRMTLTPVAIREGAAFVATVYEGRPTEVDYTDVASAVFSRPEVGAVGLTERQAQDFGLSADVYMSIFRPMKNTLSGDPSRMLMKLIVDAETDRVLGVHIAGPDAAEMIQALAIAVKMGATKAQFDAAVAVHPTSAEELVTMKEPVRRIRRADAA